MNTKDIAIILLAASLIGCAHRGRETEIRLDKCRKAQKNCCCTYRKYIGCVK